MQVPPRTQGTPDLGAHTLTLSPRPVSLPTCSPLPTTPLSSSPKSLTPQTPTPQPPLYVPTSPVSEPSSLLSAALGPRSASLLSLQTELLLDLVAEAQSRRLEEQRATFQAPQNTPSPVAAPPRPLEEREQLYSTILSHQVRRARAQSPRSTNLWGPGHLPHSTPAPTSTPSQSIQSASSHPGLSLLDLTSLSPFTPPVPADGSPAVRAAPTPGGTGAPGVAAESSGWGTNGRAKIPAPHTHLLRPRPPASPSAPLGAQSWEPTRRLPACAAGETETADAGALAALAAPSTSPGPGGERRQPAHPGSDQAGRPRSWPRAACG